MTKQLASAQWAKVVFIALVIIGFTGCSDAVASRILAPHSGRGDEVMIGTWSCSPAVVYSNGSEFWTCHDTAAPTLPPVITLANQPPADPPPADAGCVINCNDPTGSGGYSGPAGDPNDGDVGLPTMNPWPVEEAIFDCTKVKCPTAREIINSPVVQKACAILYALSQQDGLEHGVFLFLNGDGTIRVGPVLNGEPTTIPALTYAPPNAIGSIHSHPTSDWGPSGNDGANARFNHIYVAVVSSSWIWVVNPDGTGAFQMHRDKSFKISL